VRDTIAFWLVLPFYIASRITKDVGCKGILIALVISFPWVLVIGWVVAWLMQHVEVSVR
jgi:hypothetical protein